MTASGEMIIRFGCFLGAFIIIAALEHRYPRRARTIKRAIRWLNNLGISTLNQLLSRLLLPVSAAVLAEFCQDRQWGFLNNITTPSPVAIVISILLFDLGIYLQHRLFHVVPILWRLHRVHHADTDFDVTTGLRFHPLSILLSALIKLALVIIIGPPVVAVVIFEIVLNATSLFNHSNLHLSKKADGILRHLIVTPDMHRVHHSIDTVESNQNFGFNFSWWDRLFSSYRAQPKLGHQNMEIGLRNFRSDHELRIDKMLSQPFRS